MRSGTIGLVLAAAWIGLYPAESTGSPTRLAERVAADSLLGVAVSLLFVPLDGVGPQVAHHRDLPLPPASLQKLITSAAALDLLGPDHTFATRLLADQPIRSGTIAGDLYLQGEGDPFLVTERLWMLAHEAAMQGLRRVNGVLIVEAETDPWLEEIRRGEDRERAYAAPVSRLAVNFNSLTFLVRPGEMIGGPAAVWLDPFPIPRLTIEGGVRTGRPGSALQIDAVRSDRGSTDVWRITGSIPIDANPVRFRRAGREPAMLAGGVLAGLLGQNGIPIQAIRQGTAPDLAVLVAEVHSQPLGAMLRSMNSWSNNFMADLLCSILGDVDSGRSGAEVIAEWYEERTGPAEGTVVVDGSGLSIANRQTAGQIVRLLLWASDREQIFPDLYASLPRPGGEGTLQARFDPDLPPAVRAKTGTLADQGVAALAGYLDHPTEGRYAFCIIQRAEPGGKIGVGELRNREEIWIDLFLER